MGDVYLATDALLEREVAVKVLSDRYAESPEIRRRFTREALAAARLSGQPHVVTIFDVGEHEGRPFIVMAYMAGGSVEQRLRAGGVGVAQSLDWLEQAGTALDAAHRLGIVHRDVKPGNLLLDGADVVHVGDLGIARAAGLDSLTSPGTVLGTAGYISPEQAAGMSATTASDRYALGIVAYELLAGERPFATGSTAGEALAHAQATAPPIHQANPELPASLDRVFQRALAKSPQDRPASCAELVRELRTAFWEGEAPTQLIAVPPPPTAAQPTLATQRRPSRIVGVAAAAAALALAGAGVAAYLAFAGGGAPSASASTSRSTAPLRTVTETVTTSTSTSGGETGAQSPAQLNDAGYAKLRAGDAAGALPLLEQAVNAVQGSGTILEAYASYNLAWARFAVGRCDGVLALLDRSQAIHGHRSEIDRLRAQVEERCGGAPTGDQGQGRGRGKGKKEGHD